MTKQIAIIIIVVISKVYSLDALIDSDNNRQSALSKIKGLGRIFCVHKNIRGITMQKNYDF